eukprot:scpid82852/ scgid34920/ 
MASGKCLSCAELLALLTIVSVILPASSVIYTTQTMHSGQSYCYDLNNYTTIYSSASGACASNAFRVAVDPSTGRYYPNMRCIFSFTVRPFCTILVDYSACPLYQNASKWCADEALLTSNHTGNVSLFRFCGGRTEMVERQGVVFHTNMRNVVITITTDATGESRLCAGSAFEVCPENRRQLVYQANLDYVTDLLGWGFYERRKRDLQSNSHKSPSQTKPSVQHTDKSF